MENLYIWHQRDLNIDIYPSSEDYIFKSTFDIKKPKKYNDAEEYWKQTYADDYVQGVGKYKFPEVMYLIITNKKYKEIIFDYYDLFKAKLVSEDFLSFLNKNGIDDTYYEKAVLRILDVKGKTLTNKNYFALYFNKDDKDYFNLHEETKELAIDSIDSYFSFFDEDDGEKEIPKEKDAGDYLYPDIELIKYGENKNVFSLFEFYYSNCLIFSETAKDYIIKNFYAFEIYNTKDFPKVCNHYNFEELPIDNEYRIYK